MKLVCFATPPGHKQIARKKCASHVVAGDTAGGFVRDVQNTAQVHEAQLLVHMRQNHLDSRSDWLFKTIITARTYLLSVVDPLMQCHRLLNAIPENNIVSCTIDLLHDSLHFDPCLFDRLVSRQTFAGRSVFHQLVKQKRIFADALKRL